MYPDEQSESARLYERACRVLPGGNTRSSIFLAPYPIYARSGQGCRITDVDGVERIDFLNNYTTLIHGHCHPAIVDAVTRQLGFGASFAQPTEVEVEMAELLCERVPSFEKVRFTNSGTEAVMSGIKAARAYTGRPKIAKCEGVYHGTYDYAEVSLDSTPENWGGEAPAAVPFAKGTPAKVLEDVVVIPYNDPQAAERILAPLASELACVLIDPMSAKVGMVPASEAFLTWMRGFTRRHGIVLMLDEVITFRVGYRGMQHTLGLEPDLTSMGKIIGGGLPIGALAGRNEIMTVFDPSEGRPQVPHAGTFNANPLTMTAGLTAMKLMTPEAFERINTLGEKTRGELRRAFQVAGVPGQVTGQGSLFMIHLHDRPLSDYRSMHDAGGDEAMAAVFRYFLNNGIVTNPHGMGALSTVMTDSEVDRLAETLLEALRAPPKKNGPE